MGRRSARILAALALAVAFAALPTVVLAHPLGNFTINHYAGITVRPSQVDLDIVIDMAEIPAFQERQRMDTDADGEVTDEEIAAASPAACAATEDAIALAIDGRPVELAPSRAALTFPSGLGGLSTMRLECGFNAAVELSPDRASTLTFSDGSYPERIGWREIVVSGDGVEIDAADLPATSPSQRLTAYPEDLLAQPLDIREATIQATLLAAPAATAAPVSPTVGPKQVTDAGVGGVAAVPGGIGGELPDVFRVADLTALALVLSFATAFGLGAGHALTPGHGKTLMAAYLVGRRGDARHAIGLGLAVAASHTLGILALAAVVVGAEGALPPDVVVRVTPVVAAITFAAIGGWMLVGEIRRRVAPGRQHADGEPGAAHEHPDDHEHGHEHGGVRHSHLPSAGSTITWRGLFALGFAGGLIPSTNALFILLGAIVAGRPAFGFVLVIVFGLGMAVVMTGVGLAMVFARDRLDRLPSGAGVGRLVRHAPLAAAVVVLAFGVYLTAQAVGGRPVL
ncbi:MAG TPA: sulfite exporter TauE/SafE family protein [Candidatus Limnocylindrales bacterium]|nr:sulfite exporter TauE/SafE family protein [Candidatus Limnocylindrales bacterium]